MPRVTWTDLEAIYTDARFEEDGTTHLTIRNEAMLSTLLLIERDEDAADDSGIAVLTDHDQLEIGHEALIRCNPPRTSLGRLVPSFANLIAGPKARVEEPRSYFVIDQRITRNTQPPDEIQAKYRATLCLVELLAQSAVFLDKIQQELVFFSNQRIMVPIEYELADLISVDPTQVNQLIKFFEEPVHLEQKQAILSEAVIDLVAGLPARHRFKHIMREISDLTRTVAAGYRLFASSFTYSKIRREVESAQAEFIARIHKTFVDLQGQILAIPVATIVVASQLKSTDVCSAEVWTNVAVVAGAWIFVLFLIASIVNQWLTLSSIKFEFKRQQQRLLKDFEPLQTDFNEAFNRLTQRVCWHQSLFIAIGTIGVCGAAFATWVAIKITSVAVMTCM